VTLGCQRFDDFWTLVLVRGADRSRRQAASARPDVCTNSVTDCAKPEKPVMALLTAVLVAALLLTSAVITAWMAGAIYYDACRGARWARWLVAGWTAGVIALFAVWQPLWQPFAILLGVAVLFLGWWLRLKPSHNRDWDPTVARLPRALRPGDDVTLENIRNFEYRSLDDFTPHDETRTVHLANLRGLDVIFFNWGSPWMSHPGWSSISAPTAASASRSKCATARDRTARFSAVSTGSKS